MIKTNKRTVLVLVAVIALCLSAVCRAASPTPPPSGGAAVRVAPDAPPRTTLDADIRLDRRVTFHGVGVSLAGVAAALSDKTLTLRADPDCADLKVQMRVRGRPLRAVMAALARLLPGEWVPSDAPGRGYALTMSRDAQQDRARWWDTFLAEHDREVAIRQAQVLASMQAPAAATPPDPAEGGAATHSDRGQRFFNSLPPPLQNTVAAQMDDSIFYKSEPSTGSSEVEVATVLPVSGLPTEAQSLLDQELGGRPKRPADLKDLSKVSIVLANSGIGVFASLLAPGDDGMDDLFISHRWGGPELPFLYPWRQNSPPLADSGGPDVPPAWQTLTDYQRRRVWADDLPKPDRKAPRPAYFYPPTRTVDWLTRVGDKADIDYVADYHSLAQSLMTPQEMDAPLAGPLKQELDAGAVAHDVSWKRTEDGLYLVRDNRWYRDDEMEVPNSVLKQLYLGMMQVWDARAASPPTAAWPEGVAAATRQIDVESGVAASLTPWQIANGLALYVQEAPDAPAAGGTPPGQAPPRPKAGNPYEALGQRVLSERHTLAFYAGLNGAERTALVAGRLPASALGADQLAQAVALAPALAGALAASGEGGPPVLLGIHRTGGQHLRLFPSPPPTPPQAVAAAP